MIQTIRITSKSGQDSKGRELLEEISRTLKIKNIKQIRTVKIYRLEGLTDRQAKKFTEIVLYEPINQKMSFNRPIFNGASRVLEVAYKPGVMNPEVGSLLKSAKDLRIPLIAADSSWEYAFFGKIKEDDLKKIT